MSKRRNRQTGNQEQDEEARGTRLASLLPYASDAGPLGYVIAAAGLAVLIIGLGVLIADYREGYHASVYTPVTELQFPDPVLRECVVEEAERNGWDVSGEVLRLGCNKPERDQVTDLAGIENLINLIEVNLAHNAVSDTGPLGELNRLETLDLGYNAIEAPALAPLRPTLRTLNLDHNRLNTLDWVSDLPRLESLSAGHNRIADAGAVARLEQLRVLNLEHNTLTDIAPVSDLGKLEVLSLEGNGIRDVSPLGGLENLLVLDLGANRVTDITALASLPRLFELNLSENPVSNVAPLAEISTLGRLDLSGTGIQEFNALAGLGRLEAVDLTDTGLSCEQYRALAQALGSETIRHDLECRPR